MLSRVLRGIFKAVPFALIVVLMSAVIFAGALEAQEAAKKGAALWKEGEKDGTPEIELKLPSFAPIVEQLGGSVVNISTESEIKEEKRAKSRNRFMPPRANPHGFPFDFFFQLPESKQRTFETLGSGFVLNREGYIVTNNHVVEKATKVFVTFHNEKKQYDAQIIGRDPKTDLALLQVEGREDLDPVVLGKSQNLRPGDWVIAIGNPYRLAHTATLGIVSALSRRVPGGGPYDAYIQTDAAINPGNSGGPLFNARGEVVGVNTAIYRDSGSNVGIGFAIPIDLVKSIIEQLHAGGKVTRGWLGVLIQPVSPEVAEALDLKDSKGSLVAQVMKGSPAADAGFEHGDVIVRYHGKPVTENSDLPLMVADTEIGKTVKVEVIRHGKLKELDVTIAELEETATFAEPTESEPTFGLSVQEVTPEIAGALGLDGSDGVVIAEIEIGSAGADSGLLRGDVVLEVDGTVVSTPEDFRTAMLKSAESGKPILLLVRRSGNTVFLTVQPKEE